MAKFRTELTCVWPPGASRQANAAVRRQSEQLIEVVETIVTRDQPFVDRDGSWGTRPMPPSGEGWSVADCDDEHATRWERRRVIPARVQT